MNEYPVRHEDEEFYSKAIVLAMRLSDRTSKAARTVWTALNVILVLLAAFAVISFLIMFIDRSVPTAFQTVEIVSPSVRAGESVKVHFVLTRNRSCELNASYDVIDGEKEIKHFEAVHQDAMGRVGLREDLVKAFPVPISALPGNARLRLKWSWECPVNLIHPIYPVTLVWPDLPFEILSK